MSELTPLLRLPYPSEYEEPYFPIFKNGQVQGDAVMHALAENCNLTFLGGGDFSWNIGTSTFAWSEELRVKTYTSPFQAVIPTQSFVMEEGDILFFQMFRRLAANFTPDINKGKKIVLSPIRLNDLILLAYREEGIIYLPNGKSILSGESGPAFGGGLGPGGGATPSDHVHVPAFKIEPGAPGVTVINIGYTTPILLQARIYRNGARQSAGDDYTLNTATGDVTLTQATADATERFVIDVIRTP